MKGCEHVVNGIVDKFVPAHERSNMQQPSSLVDGWLLTSSPAIDPNFMPLGRQPGRKLRDATLEPTIGRRQSASSQE